MSFFSSVDSTSEGRRPKGLIFQGVITHKNVAFPCSYRDYLQLLQCFICIHQHQYNWIFCTKESPSDKVLLLGLGTLACFSFEISCRCRQRWVTRRPRRGSRTTRASSPAPSPSSTRWQLFRFTFAVLDPISHLKDSKIYILRFIFYPQVLNMWESCRGCPEESFLVSDIGCIISNDHARHLK